MMSTAPELMPGSTSSTFRSIDNGGVAGLGVTPFSYLVTYLLVSSIIENSMVSRVPEALDSNVSTWRVAGWVFMSARGVTTRFPGLSGATSSASLIEGVEAPSLVLHVVPVVVLLTTGVLTAIVGGAFPIRDGALAGTGTTVGYLVSALAGITLFIVSVGDAAVSPNLAASTLLAGVAYPAVLSAIGGVAAATLR